MRQCILNYITATTKTIQRKESEALVPVGVIMQATNLTILQLTWSERHNVRFS